MFWFTRKPSLGATVST